MSFTHILLPVDGSSHAKKAGQIALDMAKNSGATVTILYCVERIPSLIGGDARTELMEELQEKAMELLAEPRAKFINEGVKCSIKIAHGSPAQAILSTIESDKCDLIVMGTRGLSEIEGIFLGSVAHKVLHSANIPVLVVK